MAEQIESTTYTTTATPLSSIYIGLRTRYINTQTFLLLQDFGFQIMEIQDEA
jgi:hypothetical protein